MGFIFGMRLPILLAIAYLQHEPLTFFGRDRQHFPIWRWYTRHYENTRTVYGGIGNNIRVKIKKTLAQTLIHAYAQTIDSFFMSIGSVIRSDADPRLHDMYRRAQRRPIVMMANPAWRRA